MRSFLSRSRLFLVGLVVGLVITSAGIAAAVDGLPLVMGTTNTSTTGTSYTSTDLNAPALSLTGMGSVGGAATLYAVNNSGQAAVEGISTTMGVDGESTSGVAVSAITPCCNNTGTALKVDGTAAFLRSGIVTIAYPYKSATVVVGSNGYGMMTNKSMVLATIQNSTVDGVWVESAMPVLSGSSDSLTIHLNKAPGTRWSHGSVVVGWFVVEHP